MLGVNRTSWRPCRLYFSACSWSYMWTSANLMLSKSATGQLSAAEYANGGSQHLPFVSPQKYMQTFAQGLIS